MTIHLEMVSFSVTSNDLCFQSNQKPNLTNLVAELIFTVCSTFVAVYFARLNKSYLKMNPIYTCSLGLRYSTYLNPNG